MRILWITNTIFPAPSKLLGIPTPVMGGWMYSSAEAIAEKSDINLGVASLYSGKHFLEKNINNITYYLIPFIGDNKKYNKCLEPLWKQVKNRFEPDIIHIHGTEYAHGLAYIRTCGNNNVIISIQGLVSVIAQYYEAGISLKDQINNISIRNFIRPISIYYSKRQFYKRGLIEKEIVSGVKHVIGRTSWDKVHTLAINPNLTYHFCNESLREPFYKNIWTYAACEKHTMFLSQAGYPIKGFHQVLKAMPFILREFPDTKIKIAGYDIYTCKNWKDKLKQNDYSKYINSLIKKHNLKNNIEFTGLLNENAMCKQLLKANVFVCASSIENSPNSLGEAQLLGVPCVASYVGGIPDMITHGETGLLYRFEEVEMLAENICKVFRSDILANKLSLNGIKVANHRHCRNLNRNKILDIYSAVINQPKYV